MAKAKPILAPNEQITFDDPRIPKKTLCSDKLDGMRFLALDGVLYSRNLKPLRSEIQDRWKDFLQAAQEAELVFDGEIFEYDNPDFGSLMSKITRGGADVPDSLGLYCFDCVPRLDWGRNARVGAPYKDRQHLLEYSLTTDSKLSVIAKGTNVKALQQYWIDSPELLERQFEEALSRGTEGLIARDPNAQYKHGRGTLREGVIFKFKKWETQDGRITGFNQGTRMKEEVRTGTRTRDAFGHLERSHCQDTREAVEEIGSIEITLQDGRVIGAGIKKGVDIGLSWGNRETFLGKWVEVEYMEHGSKTLPRFSRITRLRPDLDL